MTATDDFAWNAFAYTYNNYAREVSRPTACVSAI